MFLVFRIDVPNAFLNSISQNSCQESSLIQPYYGKIGRDWDTLMKENLSLSACRMKQLIFLTNYFCYSAFRLWDPIVQYLAFFT
jgi:hypothetical protein